MKRRNKSTNRPFKKASSKARTALAKGIAATEESHQGVVPLPRSLGAACNICGGTTFNVGPGGRMSITNVPPACESCGSLERHRIWRAMFNQFRTIEFRAMSCLMFGRSASVAAGRFKSMS